MAVTKLTPDNIKFERGLKVCQKIIPWGAVWNRTWTDNKGNVYQKNSKYKADRLLTGGTGKPKGLVIHNTGDGADAETYTRATYPNCNMGTVRVHYYIDEKEIWQNLAENEVGWHCANSIGNDTTLSIEIIMGSATQPKDLQAETNGAKWAAVLLLRHNLSVDDMHSHYYWNKKNCPVWIRPHWQEFKTRVENYMKQFEMEDKMAEEAKKKAQEVVIVPVPTNTCPTTPVKTCPTSNVCPTKPVSTNTCPTQPVSTNVCPTQPVSTNICPAPVKKNTVKKKVPKLGKKVKEDPHEKKMEEK